LPDTIALRAAASLNNQNASIYPVAFELPSRCGSRTRASSNQAPPLPTFDSHATREATKGGPKGKMETGTKQVSVRDNAELPSRTPREDLAPRKYLISSALPLNPTKSDYKNKKLPNQPFSHVGPNPINHEFSPFGIETGLGNLATAL
jgi:hypothetical protein